MATMRTLLQRGTRSTAATVSRGILPSTASAGHARQVEQSTPRATDASPQPTIAPWHASRPFHTTTAPQTMFKPETNDLLKSMQKSDPYGFNLRRCMIYVPGGSNKMIKRSQEFIVDTIIYDLEDSVTQAMKGAARENVLHGMAAAPRPGPELAVRINAPSAVPNLAQDDLDVILASHPLQAIVVPKVESVNDLWMIVDKIVDHRGAATDDQFHRLALILSVESAHSLYNIGDIVKTFQKEVVERGLDHLVRVEALLFASEDYCASTGILRSRNRTEILYPRAFLATVAKAFGLQAIDMVCLEYKGPKYIEEESTEGKALGYDGKQAIHMSQIPRIMEAFSISDAQVERAQRIKDAYEAAGKEGKGAVGFKDGDEYIMIDEPMLKQATQILTRAHKAGVHVPKLHQLSDHD